MESISSAKAPGGRVVRPLLASAVFTVLSLFGLSAFAQGVAGGAPGAHGGGEDSLVVPDAARHPAGLRDVGEPPAPARRSSCRRSASSSGSSIFMQLKNAPVHKSMLEVSELIYETCKTYLFTQAKFLGLLWLFIGTVIVVYYGVLKGEPAGIVVLILFFSILGIAGSGARRALRHPREHVREFAHGVREPEGQAVPGLRHPAQGRHEHRHDAHQHRARDHARDLDASSRTSTRASASSASPSASRSAPRRSASPAASSRRSPTSART